MKTSKTNVMYGTKFSDNYKKVCRGVVRGGFLALIEPYSSSRSAILKSIAKKPTPNHPSLSTPLKL